MALYNYLAAGPAALELLREAGEVVPPTGDPATLVSNCITFAFDRLVDPAVRNSSRVVHDHDQLLIDCARALGAATAPGSLVQRLEQLTPDDDIAGFLANQT